MRLSRGVSLTLLSFVALPWATALSVAGLWLLTTTTTRWISPPVTTVGGVTLMAAGQLVFLVCVADRCFPAAARRIGPWIETPISLVILGGFVASVVLFAAQAFGGTPS